MKPLKSGHLRVLEKLSVIKRCPLLGGSLTKIVTFGTNLFFRYSRHVGYLVCPLLEGFTGILITKTQKCLMTYPLGVFKLNIGGINYHMGKLKIIIAIAHYNIK